MIRVGLKSRIVSAAAEQCGARRLLQLRNHASHRLP